MDAKQNIFRILMFPWLAHGHVFPFLELAKRLSKKNFYVYICSTRTNLDSISLCCNDVSIELLELHLPPFPELPPQYHTTKNIPPHLMPVLMQSFQKSTSSFSNIITNLKPDLLIYDGFQPWSAKLAKSQGIPSVHFATSSATTFSFFHHMYTYKNYDTFPYPLIYLHEYEKKNIVAEGESIKVEDEDDGFVFGIFKLSCDIVLIKSCKGIEGKYMDYLSKLCEKRIVPTGSLVTTKGSNGQECDSSEIMKWLSKKNLHSTLYISFGSENYLLKEQMEEIAKGLELSNVNFIWVVRFPVGSNETIEDSLPKGFLDRVQGRGIVVQKWASQTEILSHSSVGGFMSHCGWSSVTESIYFAVPVVAMPLKLDQPLNSRLVLEAGVGVEVERDENGQFKGEDVANAIYKVIMAQTGESFRYKAKELSEKMKMEEEHAIDEVAAQLLRICVKK